ncbi:MAG: deoxyribonuclease IV [Candidatus Hodarchaeales archaeon]|jgi:deoxyribonuclease-4
MTLKVGFHLSIAGGIHKSFQRAAKLGCDTFQVFTRNPRSWKYKKLSEKDIDLFKRTNNETKGISPIYSHMPYLPNLSSPDKEVREKSLFHLELEIKRCQMLNIPYIITHCGSHKGKGKKTGIENITALLAEALTGTEDKKPILLLENTSGGKNSVGDTLEELVQIIINSSVEEYLGICYDTCHGFAAGIGDIRTRRGIDELYEILNVTISINKVKVIHLNDSKGVFNGKLDRHEHIGLGKIGKKGFKLLLNDIRFSNIPMILETPVDDIRKDEDNIAFVRKLIQNDYFE